MHAGPGFVPWRPPRLRCKSPLEESLRCHISKPALSCCRGGHLSGEGAVASGYVLRSFDLQGALAEDDSSRRQQLAGCLSRHSCRFAFRGGLRRCAAPLACIRGKDLLARYILSNFRLRRGSASRFLCTVLSFRARRLRSRRHRKPSKTRKG